MLGEGIQRLRRGVRTAWTGKKVEQLLGHLSPLFKASDLCFGNLECMLGPLRPANLLSQIYIGDPAHLPGLRGLGFTHLSLANNHILEQGLATAQATKSLVASAGITPCCGPNPTRSFLGGLAVDLFAFNLIHDTPHFGFYRHEITQADLDAIQNSDAQVKIISVHWGHEYSQYPSPEQVELAHRLAEAGASLVLGHHPHVVQGIEAYGGAIIAYSLGNFVFDMNWSEETRSSMILQTETRGGKTRVVELRHLRQDDIFVPQPLPALPDARILDDPLRFYRQPDGAYVKYRDQRLKRSRLRAIVYLLKNFHRVHSKTWQVLISKRLPTLRTGQSPTSATL